MYPSLPETAAESDPFMPEKDLKPNKATFTPPNIYSNEKDLKPYETTFTPPNDYSKGGSNKKEKGCCACTCKCWSICCAVFVILVGIIALAGYLVISSKFTGTASEEDAAKWDEMLTTGNGTMTIADMAGVYELVSFKNIDAYFTAIGVPSFAISFLKKMSEVKTVEPPDDPTGEWSITTETDLGARETRFRLGEEFTRGYGRNMDDGIMYITATNPEPHILMYRSEERLKGWSFETNQSFSPLGMKMDAYFITEDVRLTKYYERTNKEEWEAEKSRQEAENPFGDSADDVFAHDDDFMDDGWMDDDADDEDRSPYESRDEFREQTTEWLDYQTSQSGEEFSSPWENGEDDEDGYFSGDDQEYEEAQEDDWMDGW